MTGFVVFLKEFIALYYWYIELFTRKILNIHSWITSCPDGITPNSGLTGPRILYISSSASYRAGSTDIPTLSRHSSLYRPRHLHVSSHSCWMYVRAGRPAFARPCVGIHKRTSLMSSSLLLQQCPACLVRLTWIVFVIGGRWPYSWCLVGCCCQDLFRIARSILV